MTISPSSTHRFGSCFFNGSSSSGKYRLSGFSSRLCMKISSPSRKISVRNPSHLGSKIHPSPGGSSLTLFASIGSTGGLTARFMSPSTAVSLPAPPKSRSGGLRSSSTFSAARPCLPETPARSHGAHKSRSPISRHSMCRRGSGQRSCPEDAPTTRSRHHYPDYPARRTHDESARRRAPAEYPSLRSTHHPSHIPRTSHRPLSRSRAPATTCTARASNHRVSLPDKPPPPRSRSPGFWRCPRRDTGGLG